MRQRRKAHEYADKLRSELEADIAARREKIDREAQIAEALPRDLPIYMIHPRNLYGTCGSVWVNDREGGASWGELCDMLALMPPVPMEIRRAGCTAIRPVGYSEDRDSESDRVTPIHGLRFEAESPSYAGPSTVAKWVTRLRAGMLVEIEVHIKHAHRPAWLEVEYKRDRSSGTVTGIKSKTPRRADWFWSEHFMYAGGGGTDPGRAVFYLPQDYYSHEGDELAEALAGLVDGFEGFES